MATVVKPYTFINRITAEASEVNADFDGLYTTINGFSSENLIAGSSFAASAITITDTASNYTNTDVEGLLGEARHFYRGLHTIHVVPQGTNAAIVFPGKVEINCGVYVVSTKFETTIGSFADSAAAGDVSEAYIVCGPPASGEEITASDLFLVNASSVEVTAGIDPTLRGFYYSGKRLIGAVKYWQGMYPWNNPDPVQKSFRTAFYYTSGNIPDRMFDITHVFAGGGTITGTRFYGMSAFYDMYLGHYGYYAEVYMNTASSLALDRFGSVCAAAGAFIEYSWTPHSRTSINSSTNTQYSRNSSYLSFQITQAGFTAGIQILARPSIYAWNVESI